MSEKILKLFFMSSRPHGLSVVNGQGRRRAQIELGGFRLRPGERPAWIELELGYEELAAWRHLAAESGLSVDVWVALQVEWTLVVEDVGAERSKLVVERARATAESPTLAPTQELRTWVAYLRASGAQSDDLPSLALPQRLLARLHPADIECQLRARLAEASIDDAAVVELAAASVGMTLEAWAYRESAGISGRY
jgi:hypothetical protein